VRDLVEDQARAMIQAAAPGSRVTIAEELRPHRHLIVDEDHLAHAIAALLHERDRWRRVARDLAKQGSPRDWSDETAAALRELGL
jgi:hypothetical protein